MRWLLLLALVACGDNNRPQQQDAGVTPDVAPLAGCLDKPNDLPRPPTGQLPCELVPPGLVLSP